MSNFADRMIEAIRRTGNPCVVGLDPRLEAMPDFVLDAVRRSDEPGAVGTAITTFHEHVIAAVADHVPAVKVQIAFFEQYGLPGMQAFADTIALARAAGLVVIADAKRNDIDSTARAYANAYLGRAEVLGRPQPAFDVDCLTVTPFLGRDSLEPFVEACAAHGKGVFVLVKTSNPGSREVQDQQVADGETISARLARLVHELGGPLVGDEGYSSVGAVVGATFPQEAEALRRLMPEAIILVPGYGAQGGTAEGATANFNADGLGAVVNASRSITYAFGGADVSPAELEARLRDNVLRMAEDITGALARRVVS
jgi:orotidine-5'-phosphate decarboxylase